MLDYVPLSDEQKRQFDDEGYLIVRGVLDSEAIAILIEASDRLIASDNQLKRQVQAKGLFDSFRNCIALDDAFIPLLTHQKTLPLVVQLLGPNLHLTTSHLIYRHPDPRRSSTTRRIPTWHRDIPNASADLGYANVPRLQLKCAFYLTDLTEPNSGATLVLPGSNHLKEPLNIPEDLTDPIGVLEPHLAPGDCMLFENRTWHAGGANLSGRIRKAVMFGYGYRWLKPSDYIRQTPRFLEKLDPLGRFLLGESLEPSERFRPGGGPNPLKDWCVEHGVKLGMA